jgi:23S rRNA pseudouridine1911/1915/1917 synthase
VDYFDEIDGGFSRSSIQKLIKTGGITVDGCKVKPSASLKGGELITMHIPCPEPPSVKPQNIPLNIVYEDDYLVVINKPAGMVVHPAAGNPDGTLINAVLFATGGKISNIGSPLRPGIVHRLDKDTSGLIVVAKNDAVHLDLARQFAVKAAGRIYIAVVWGRPKGIVKGQPLRIESLLGRHPSDRKKFSSMVKSGKHAVTEINLVESGRELSILRVRLETGRTHQIRVHCLENGFPIVGDTVYSWKKSKDNEIGRQALHAKSLCFMHPVLEKTMCFFAPVASDIDSLIAHNF